jgi:hypothetical protein
MKADIFLLSAGGDLKGFNQRVLKVHKAGENTLSKKSYQRYNKQWQIQ